VQDAAYWPKKRAQMVELNAGAVLASVARDEPVGSDTRLRACDALGYIAASDEVRREQKKGGHVFFCVLFFAVPPHRVRCPRLAASRMKEGPRRSSPVGLRPLSPCPSSILTSSSLITQLGGTFCRAARVVRVSTRLRPRTSLVA
jgi:hypothetical protein